MDESDIQDQLFKPIRKSEGITSSERLLVNLCKRTFLNLWCFPNTYRDQGVVPPELCDLLVICDPHVVIFSDKRCEYPKTADIQLAWKRWYKRAIEQSVKQLYGAERWIRKFPNRIFTDSTCTQKLPLPIPDEHNVRFHRIVVASGAKEACRKYYNGGSGSMMLQGKLLANDNTNSESNRYPPPFTINNFGTPGSFLHVIDEAALKILITELDTISDFLNYLTKKEQFIESGRLCSAAGEEELLAYYLSSMNPSGEHDFVFPGYESSLVIIDDTHWADMKYNPQVQAKKDADRISYVWDRIIQKASDFIENGKMRYDSNLSIEQQQLPLHRMALEPRIRRRFLGKSIINFMKKVEPGRRGTRTLLSNTHPDTGYVFGLFPYDDKVYDQEYWKVRHGFMSVYCLVVAEKHRHLKTIIGIATESGLENKKRSEDFLYLDTSMLTEEDYEQARGLKKKHDIFQEDNLQFHEGNEDEYPEVVDSPFDHQEDIHIEAFNIGQKPARNWPCPCGSGKKYKHCCLS